MRFVFEKALSGGRVGSWEFGAVIQVRNDGWTRAVVLGLERMCWGR